MKNDIDAKFQGLQFLPKEFVMFVFAKLRNIKFSVGKKTISPVTG